MAITATYTNVAGDKPMPQSVGQWRAVVKDVVMTSDAPAGAGSVVVDPKQLGLSKIIGIVELGVYSGGAAADTPRSAGFVVATQTLQFFATDRGALTLDAADHADARILFLGY